MTIDMHPHRGICATFLRFSPGPKSVGRLRPQDGDATDAVRRTGMRSGLKLLATGVAGLGFAAAAWPWELASPTFRTAVTSHIEHDTGSTATVSGPITLKLLPRPRLQVNDLSLARTDGAVMLDAPVVKAEFDIPGLFRGEWHLNSATLVAPTVTVNLDLLTAAFRKAPSSFGGSTSPWPFRLHLRGALLRTLSSNAAGDLIATEVDATATLPQKDEAFEFSGNGILRGTKGQFAGRIERPAKALDPEGSATSLQIDSPLLTFLATGLLSGGAQEQFSGHLAASTPALPHLLRALDGFPVALGTHRAQISGDLVARPHDLSLSNVQLKLDKGRFEGSLALRRDGGRDLVQGTLATDMLDVDALIGDAANRHDMAAYYQKPLDPSSFRTDIDMRVSALESRIGRLHLDETAFAALLRDGRLEISVDEAKGYGGTLKARAIANVNRGGAEAQADVTLSRVDLGRLSEALSGQERVSGEITGTANLAGSGTSLSDIVATLDGRGQVSIEHGRLVGLSLGQTLRRLGRKLPLDGQWQGQPTAFNKADWNFGVERGVLNIPEGKLTAPGLQMSFDSRTDLPGGKTDVHAVAAQTDADGAPLQGGSRMPFDVSGSWDRPMMLIQNAGHGLPSISIPLFGADAAVP